MIMNELPEPLIRIRREQPAREVLQNHYKALFPEYDWKPHKDYITLAKEACWIYDDIIQGRSKRWLTLLGPSGIGKTEWCRRICKKLRNEGFHAEFWNWSKVCDIMSQGDYDIICHLEKIPILFIDEIGANDWKTANKKLGDLGEYRRKRWTIFTSNQSQSEIASVIDTRIASRLGREENRIFEASADCPDYDNSRK